jgi:phage repressor protein C with HTH and peptisase S24 domain
LSVDPATDTTPVDRADGSGRWPCGRVAVRGASMLPTLAPGDLVVVRLPGRPVGVKRVVRRVGHGWWVEGDNPAASTDSRTFGPVASDAVVGRVVLRYWPLPVRRVS